MKTTDDLFAGLDLAVFEEQPDGAWHAVGLLPDWLALPAGPLDLLDCFPMLEVFLPDCDFAKRSQSDTWTEPDPRNPGEELYLQAVACGTDERKFLALRTLPGELLTWQQLAHDVELEKEKVERLSRELEQKRREAERATEAKSTFLAAMSHEIRTPLNAIIGMADVLSGTPLNTEQHKCVEVFQRNGVALLNLINDILDLSKVEAGHMELESTDFDVREVVAAAMEVVEVRVKAKALWLNQILVPGVPFYLTGDPNRLRQIIINLLGNSIKFTDRGGLEIRVECDPGNPSARAGDQINGWLRFAISDSGIGIPEDKLGRIFESFSQADASTTRKYGGTGLGLSISKQLVELMEGHIWVESDVGKGSTFFFTAHFGVQQDQTDRKPVSTERTSVEDLEAGISGLKILLVDDSDDNRSLILAYLKNIHSHIEIAENGLIATQMFRKNRYDVILMDVEMPVMDGYEATSEIRKIEAASGAKPTPVFALTAHAFADMAVKGYAAGFTELLTKPIRKVTLLEAVAGHSSSGEAVTHAAPAQSMEESFTVMVEDGMEDVVPGYLEKRRAEVPLYQTALAANDFETIKNLAHKMKGTGSGYGFPRLTELGSILEQAAIGDDAAQIGEALKQLAGYTARVKLVFP